MSEDPYHKYMYEQIHLIDGEKVKKLLQLYLARCSYINYFAFLQYRKLCKPDKTLQNIFNERKSCLLGKLDNMMEKIQHKDALADDEFIEEDEIPIENLEEPKHLNCK